MNKKHTAFFASPYSKEFQWVRNAVATACRELNIEFRSVDEIVLPGTNIVPAIHYEITQSSFAFVVISGLNPNVLYELGLLHSQSKPTVILTDQDTFESLPFDLRSLLVIRYDSKSKNEDELKIITSAAAIRILRMIEEPNLRSNIAVGNFEIPEVPTFDTAQLNIGQMDFEALKKLAEKAVGRKNCSTNNISEHDDGEIQGWKLKAKCPGGSRITVIIDLNGDIREVNVDD